MPVPLEQQIAAVEREISMRKRVYPNWVASHKLTSQKAAHEIEAMEAVLETLQSIQSDRKRVGLFDSVQEAIDR